MVFIELPRLHGVCQIFESKESAALILINLVILVLQINLGRLPPTLLLNKLITRVPVPFGC